MKVSNLSYQHVLKGVSLELGPGETCCVVGENGSSKSTLLKCLSGFSKNHQGEITLNQCPVNKMSETDLSRHRSVLSQYNTVHTSMSGKDYIKLSSLLNRDANELAEGIEAVSLLLNMGHLLQKDYLQCSGGEQQKLHLARVLLHARFNAPHAHKYLLLDEPFSHLDVAYVPTVIGALETYKQQGFGIVLVVHDLHLAHQLSDQVLFLRQGQTVAYGSTHDTFHTKALSLTFGIGFESVALPGGTHFMPVLKTPYN